MLTPRNFLESDNTGSHPGSRKLLRIAAIATLTLAEILGQTGCGRPKRNPSEFMPAEAPEVEAPAQAGTDETPQIPRVPREPSSVPSTSPDGKKSCEDLERENARLTIEVMDLTRMKMNAMRMLGKCGDAKCMHEMMKDQGQNDDPTGTPRKVHMTFDASPSAAQENFPEFDLSLDGSPTAARKNTSRSEILF